jgi:hypothetical protein
MSLVTTRHYNFEDPYFAAEYPEAAEPSTITFITKSLPLALLRTTKTIHAEALPYLTPTMEELRQEPQRMIVDSPSLSYFRVLLEITGYIFEISHSIDYTNISPHSTMGRKYHGWWPTPFPPSSTRLKDKNLFCKACAYSLLARFPKMAVEKVKKGVVAIRRYLTCDRSDLTQAVRRLRDELYARSDWHEAFGVSKQIVLLSDA